MRLKGQCHEIFRFWFFSSISFPPAPEYPNRTVSNFFENSRRYLQVKVHHRCQRHRWQICHRWQIAAGINDTGGKFATGINRTGCKFCHQFPLCCWHWWQICRRCQWRRWQIIRTISGCRHLKVNLKAKIYIYVNSTTQRWQKKIMKIFLLEDFFHLPPVSLTPVVHLEPRISPRIFEKIQNGRNGKMLGGNWFMKKTRCRKSCDNVPLKVPKCEILMSWILRIFLSWSLYR
jgi:hypothetical protein